MDKWKEKNGTDENDQQLSRYKKQIALEIVIVGQKCFSFLPESTLLINLYLSIESKAKLVSDFHQTV